MICCGAWLIGLIWLPVVSEFPTRHRLTCRRCGYSLVGNVSGVCPECGTSRDESNARQAERPLQTIRLALVVLAAAVIAHASFVLRYLPYVVDPESSPYGYESAFGGADGAFGVWCLFLPASLIMASSFAGAGSVLELRKRGFEGSREIAILWTAHVAGLLYLTAIQFWLFD